MDEDAGGRNVGSFTREGVILLSALVIFPIVLVHTPPVQKNFDGVIWGEVWMSTDKSCYEPGELVKITAIGEAYVPSIGDYPDIFWAITNSSGDLVFEAVNPLTAIGSLNGTLNGTWNQTYRFYNNKPPSGQQVPSGEYTIWFWMLAPPDWYPTEWHPTQIIIKSNCTTMVMAEAGPDQTVNEGDTVQFNGTGSQGGGGSGIWEPRQNIPSPRSAGGSAVLNSEIHYVGGGPGDMAPGISDVFQKYSPSTDSWYNLTNLPGPRARLGAAAVNGKIYAIGGEGDYGTRKYGTRNNTFEFDPATNTWTEKAPMPIAMAAFGIAVMEDRIYTIGGTSDFLNCSWCSIVYEYDVTMDSWSQKSNMPTARAFLTATTLEGKIYAIGGRTWGTVAPVEVYDPVTDTWTKRANFSYRWGQSAKTLGGKIFIFGGVENGEIASNRTDMYDATTDTWTLKTDMLSLRTEFGSGVVGNCIYAVGGNRGWMAGYPLSSEVYCLGGELEYIWDFDANVDSDGDGHYTNDVDATGPTPTHIYGDNGLFVVTLTVRDDIGNEEIDTMNVTVLNVSPSITYTIIPTGNEASSLVFKAQVTDPGSDDISIKWSGPCTGWSPLNIYPNDPTIFPDPYPSPEINPRNVIDTQTVVCGDNGIYSWNLKVEDDDGGMTTLNGAFSVMNVPPEYPPTFCPQIVGCNSTRFEGAMTDYWVAALDNGSDDLTFTWNWGDGSPQESEIYYNDGIGPDPPNSPYGTYPFFADDNRSHAYGDDGIYLISVMTQDDDGASSPIIAGVIIINLPPSLSVPPPQMVSIDEGTQVTLNATATDPGSDDLTFTWNWDYGPTYTNTYYNNGISPDPPNSPLGTFPFSAEDNSTHTYGDDCPCKVSLTVEDDDGGIVTYTTTVNVLNLPPSIVGKVEAYAKGSLILRVAGEKYHDVKATVYLNGVEKYTATVIRIPGNPDEQAVTLGNVTIDLTGNETWSARLVYTPLDDPINGQVWGATPAWLIFRSEQGNESRIHHTFNARHEDTWIWNVTDLRAMLLGIPIEFKATATDPGSDDLTFTLDSGDGRLFTMTVYNNGIGPDPYPSPEVNPITAFFEITLVYDSPGIYIVILSITDDDGGVTTSIMNITIG